MKIAVIGFSRFGQLWATLMKDFGEVLVFDRNPERKDVAQKMGVNFFTFEELDELKKADLVFISVAMSATEEVIKKIKGYLKPGSVVADVCSVKVLPCQWLVDNMPENVSLLGTHPMFGPDSIKNGMIGRQIVLCPLRIPEEKLNEIRQIFQKIGLEIIETTPQDHDQQSAYSLAMVHFIGRGLEKLDLNGIKIRTLGFDMLMQLKENVSHDSWQLFHDMQKFNPYAEEARKKLIDVLSGLDFG
ncbi:MAG: prephenate dehydrogenase/arogenate dehydrogenase family protein [Patescibacteria group bacterium]|nr:prephenate dehydrogenase/arogenate dehydrogenase family protein [Patescibacteria group bacterium]